MGRQYYGKPKYELMKDFILSEMKLQKGQTFTKSEFVHAFNSKYPRYATSGIEMSLCRLSVNDRNRYRYSPTESDNFLWKEDGHTYRLYDENIDVIGLNNDTKNKPRVELIKKPKQRTMNINEKCERLHRLFNSMKLHRFELSDINRIDFCNGIYIVFEEGERFHDYKRIVRVGTHSKPGNLLDRLNDHCPDGGTSVFRRKVGCAIMNKTNHDDIDMDRWFNKEYSLIDKDKLTSIRKSVTEHIVKKMSFVVFEVKGTKKEERGSLFWEAKIIATIAQSDDCRQSKDWLGNFIPVHINNALKPVKEYGLWLKNGVKGKSLTDDEIIELEHIVKLSMEKSK
jgi:hypothetical protein